ncbi:MAG: hypothetical protein PHE54_03080 [Bacilli bacterium]|nr:hypothetical protein [Bacilli bacterium]
MKNKHKVLLVKGVIALAAILSMVDFYYLCMLEKLPENDIRFNFYERRAIIMSVLAAISTIIMVILMMKIDIRPQKTKSGKYKLKINTFNDFKNHLIKMLINDGYKKHDIFNGKLYEIEYLIKKSYRQSDIVIMLKVPELTEEIYNKYQENYFEDFGNYLLEARQIKATDSINTIFIICVDRVTPIFSKYTESNVKQYFARYNLPVGISLGSNTLYIATQVEGYARSRWKNLSKLFYKYIRDIIDTKKEH